MYTISLEHYIDYIDYYIDYFVYTILDIEK